MKAMWRRGRATVREVLVALNRGRRKLAYTTVLTTMRNLERKGLLRRETEGRAHVYLPAVDEQAFARTAARDLLDRLFDGERARLVAALFEEEDLSRAEFEALRRRVMELRNEQEEEQDREQGDEREDADA